MLKRSEVGGACSLELRHITSDNKARQTLFPDLSEAFFNLAIYIAVWMQRVTNIGRGGA